jgi:hypothetical protein
MKTPPTPPPLPAKLHSSKDLPILPDRAQESFLQYLSALYAFAPSHDNWEFYFEHLNDFYERRAGITVDGDSSEKLRDVSLGIPAKETLLETIEQLSGIVAKNPLHQKAFPEQIQGHDQTSAQ